jgi:hypothetical protein
MLPFWCALLGATAAPQARADTPDDSSLQEVIVTATKHETKLLETPISMTVIGG